MERFRHRFLSHQSVTAATIVVTALAFIWLTVWVSGIGSRQSEDRAVQRAASVSAAARARDVLKIRTAFCTYILAIVPQPGEPHGTTPRALKFEETNRKQYTKLDCGPLTGPLPRS